MCLLWPVACGLQVALVLLGPVGNIVLFGILALIGAAVYKVRASHCSCATLSSPLLPSLPHGPCPCPCPCLLCAQFLRSVPRVASNFLSAYGLATVLDPLLTFLVDLGYHNYNCGAVRGTRTYPDLSAGRSS